MVWAIFLACIVVCVSACLWAVYFLLLRIPIQCKYSLMVLLLSQHSCYHVIPVWKKKTPQLYLICIMVVFITTVMLSSCCFLQKREPNYFLIWKIVSRHFSFTHSLYSISLFQSQWMQMKFLQQIPNIAEQLQHLTLSQSLRMISIVTVFESNWMRYQFFIWITLKRKLKNLLSSAISALFYIIK